MSSHPGEGLAVRPARLSCPGFLLTLILLCGPVFAQSWDAPRLVEMADFTAQEKIGFAFYLLSRLEPPVEDWVDADKRLYDLNPKERYYRRHAEIQRLKTGFQIYVPERDTITLHTKIRLRELTNSSVSTAEKTIGINFRSTDENIYFPFERGALWIAVQPRGLTQEVAYTITNAEFSALRQRVGDAALAGREDLTAELVTLALEADPVNPIEVGDRPLWRLTVALKEIRLLDDQDKTVWARGSDNFPGLSR